MNSYCLGVEECCDLFPDRSVLTPANRGCSVHDLPQLYTRPSADELLSTLRSLALTLTAFTEKSAKPVHVSSTGLAGYLTQIVSSSLSWLDEGKHLGARL